MAVPLPRCHLSRGHGGGTGQQQGPSKHGAGDAAAAGARLAVQSSVPVKVMARKKTSYKHFTRAL